MMKCNRNHLYRLRTTKSNIILIENEFSGFNTKLWIRCYHVLFDECIGHHCQVHVNCQCHDQCTSYNVKINVKVKVNTQTCPNLIHLCNIYIKIIRLRNKHAHQIIFQIKYELSRQIQHSLETDCIISQSQGKLNISNV